MAMINVKAAVSQASMELGIAQRPATTAVGSIDQDIVQMTALLNAVAEEVLQEEPYRTTLGDQFWLLDPTTGERLMTPNADDNIILFDGRLAIDGLKFRFMQAKGLEFGEAMRDFATRLNKLSNRINGRVIDLYVDEGRWV
jgi:hypothetical protein